MEPVGVLVTAILLAEGGWPVAIFKGDDITCTLSHYHSDQDLALTDVKMISGFKVISVVVITLTVKSGITRKVKLG